MAWEHEQSRHDRGYGYQWTKTRAQVLHRDDHLCQPCLMLGRVTPATEVDHIIPKAKDGSDDFENLQSICTDCHKDKTARERAGGRVTYDALGWPIW